MGRTIRVEPYFLLSIALAALIVPTKWLMAAVLSAAFHEICHLIAIRISGGNVFRICVGFRGTVIKTAPMPSGRELICTMAGPCGSFLLLFLARWMPELALCGLVQGLYNLLPVYPLDGGRMIRCITDMIVPQKSGQICSIFQWITLTAILFVGLLHRFWPCLLVFALSAKPVLEKFLAKRGNSQYNRPTKC